MPTYEEALREAKKLLRRQHKETSAAEMLMLHFCRLEPAQLYLNYTSDMPESAHQEFIKALKEHIEHNRPVQYIIGYVYFLGHKIMVNENVLIPRYETEELVEQVLMQYDEHFASQRVKLADIGTGSGCIAIAIKKEAPPIEVFATDISQEALAVAKSNAERLDAAVDFRCGDLLAPLSGEKFDIIVSNPPYIPETEALATIIYDNEPHLALFGGSDGLTFYKQIIEGAKPFLNERFLLAFEHAYDAAEKIHGWAKAHFPKAEITTLRDMQGKERMTFIRRV